MSQELRQTSFSGGVFAPSLHSRSDLEKYGSGLVTALNAYVTEHGNLKNRPGTVYVAQTEGGLPARLLRFMYSDDQSYILELTDLLIRVLANGGPLTFGAGAAAWDSMTRYSVGTLVTYGGDVYRCKATPAPLTPNLDPNWVFLYIADIPVADPGAWNVATAYVWNNRVSLAGSVYVASAAVTGGTGPGVDPTWVLIGTIGCIISPTVTWDADGDYTAGTIVRYGRIWIIPMGFAAKALVNVTAAASAAPDVDVAAWQLLGTAGTNVTIPVPWLEADLPRLKSAQSGDVLSTAHRNYEPGEIRRRSHTAWEYGVAQGRRPQTWRAWDQSTTYAAGDIVRSIAADALPFFGFFRALAENVGFNPAGNPWPWEPISGLTAHLPPSDVIFLKRDRSYLVHGNYITGYGYYYPVTVTISEQIDQVGDASHLPKEWVWVVTAVYGDGIESVASEPLAPRALYDKAQSRKCCLYPDKPVTITWLACPGAVAYRFYRGRSGFYGYVGEAEPSKVTEGLGGGLFQDEALAPDFARQPPTGRWPFGLRNWESLQNYRPDDYVLAANGTVYRCAVGGLSGATSPVGVSGLISDGVDTNWVKNHAYTVGNRVLSNDAVYECWLNHTSSDVDGTNNAPPGPWGMGAYGYEYDYGWWEPQTDAGARAWQFLGFGSACQWEFVSTLADFRVSQPDAVLYHEGRRYYASLGTLLGSCVDDYANFDRSNPTRDDESVSITLASREFEEVRSMVSIDGGLMALSVAGEWLVTGGGQNEPISPNSGLARRGGNRGSSWLDPVSVGEAFLFVQPRGGRVREIIWDGGQGRYAGADLSIFSRHLFEGREVVSWDYQEVPDSIVWVVFDDGTMASLTYNREHQMAAWTHHEITGGLVESVCVIPENGKDVVYLVVNRTVGAVVTRYIERLDDRTSATCSFLDGSKAYAGAPATVFSGLEHLEGKSVMAVADGVVRGPYTVTTGAVTLPVAASAVTIGLAYGVEIETLPYPQERGKQKIIAKVTLEVESGPVQFEAGETLATMSSFTPTEAGVVTRDVEIRPAGAWNLKGSAAIRVTSPTPLTIHAIRREVEGGGR